MMLFVLMFLMALDSSGGCITKPWRGKSRKSRRGKVLDDSCPPIPGNTVCPSCPEQDMEIQADFLRVIDNLTTWQDCGEHLDTS